VTILFDNMEHNAINVKDSYVVIFFSNLIRRRLYLLSQENVCSTVHLFAFCLGTVLCFFLDILSRGYFVHIYIICSY